MWVTITKQYYGARAGLILIMHHRLCEVKVLQPSEQTYIFALRTKETMTATQPGSVFLSLCEQK